MYVVSILLRFILVGTGLLFAIASPVNGQSHHMTPVWTKHAWANGIENPIRPHDLVTDNGFLYIGGLSTYYGYSATFDGVSTQFEGSSFLASYSVRGGHIWLREGIMPAPDNSFEDNKIVFHVAQNSGAVYTSEGYPFFFDANMLTAGGTSVNKYSAEGDSLWSIEIQPSVPDPTKKHGFVVGLGNDSIGNIYIGGIYRDTLVLGTDTLAAFPLEAPDFIGDVFLASYSPNGELRWSRRIGGPRQDVIAEWGDPHGAFTVDEAGNIYMGGFFSEGATFGEGQVSEATLSGDTYALASYDNEGQFRWVLTAQDLGISNNAGPWRLTVDGTGNLYVDWFVLSSGGTNTVTIGDTTFTDPGFGGEFLTKIDQAGSVIWARQIKSDGNDIVTDIAVGDNGDVYVCGFFDGIYLELEDTRLQKQDLQIEEADGFVARYNTDGELLWVGRAAGEGTQRITAIDVSEGGDLYIAGEFEQVLRLGQVELEAKTISAFELFLAKYEAATITTNKGGYVFERSNVELSVFPNPLTEKSTFQYTLQQPGHVEIEIYDILGREVVVLEDAVLNSGMHTTVFDASMLATGIYIYRFMTEEKVKTGRLIIRR